MSAYPSNGVALVCSADGRLLRVVHDDLGLTKGITPGTPLADLASQGAGAKVHAFLESLATQAAAFDWELTMSIAGDPTPLQVTGGVAEDGTLFIIAASTRAAVDRLYVELVRLNNQQTTMVRGLMKDHALQARRRDERDSAQYDEISRVNNALATAHRELAKASVELARLNEEKNQFLGMAAHDLRNPIGAIQAYSELILEAATNLTAKQVDLTTRIQALSDAMLRLVNDLLDVAKIESGRFGLELEGIGLAALVERIVNRHRPLAAKKEIRLELSMDPGPTLVSVDPAKIDQVVTNLLTNAISAAVPSRDGSTRIDRHRRRRRGLCVAPASRFHRRH